MCAHCLILCVNLTTWHNTGWQSQIMFLSVITVGSAMLSCFSGRGSLKANTRCNASSQSSMYPADGSSQASFLAENLYMDLDNGTYLYRVLVCSLARLMFCFRLWILWENLPYSHSPCPGEMLSCLYIVSDSCDGETPLAQPASWYLCCKVPWFQRRGACSACTG